MIIDWQMPDLSVFFESWHDEAIDVAGHARRLDQSAAIENDRGRAQGGRWGLGQSVSTKRMAWPHLGQRKARSWDIRLAR